MKSDTITINYWAPDDGNDTAILHADISLNGIEIASLTVSHQMYTTMPTNKTGYVEISICMEGSDEYDVINDNYQEHIDIAFAKQCIIENVRIAIRLYLATLKE